MKTKSNISDVIVIGAGPAGMTASLYLSRAGIKPVLMEKDVPGGKLNKSITIDNYPGFQDKEGTILAQKMYMQLKDSNISVLREGVINIVKKENNITIVTNKESYDTKFVVLACGKVPRKLSALNAEKFEGKGISYCAICDGFLYKNKDVIVYGDGNSAMESARYLSDLVRSVTIINKSDKLRTDKVELDIVLNKDNVYVKYNLQIKEVCGNEKIEKVVLSNDKEIKTSAIFVCMGDESNNKVYQNLNLAEDKHGIIVDENMKTSDDNVYAVGDLISKKLYQIVTATSEGAQAAVAIVRELKNQN